MQARQEQVTQEQVRQEQVAGAGGRSRRQTAGADDRSRRQEQMAGAGGRRQGDGRLPDFSFLIFQPSSFSDRGTITNGRRLPMDDGY
jgi:hypothetical protein